VDYPSSLYPGTNYTWWLRNGRFSSGLPISRADIEMEDGVEQVRYSTRSRVGKRVCVSLTSLYLSLCADGQRHGEGHAGRRGRAARRE
jgi:hypothetical protein